MLEQEFFDRAIRVTPWATQTNAKRPKLFMEETMPLFITKAKGTRMTDTLGNTYTDFFCACGPIILGYADEEVDEAVKEEIDKGFLFSAASVREFELARVLTETIPSLEWAKFMKTGGDAATAAVRLARAFTGKEIILQCGYHGWHDWFQIANGGGIRSGIPEGLRPYTIPFDYNDFDFVEKTVNENKNIAGIILTPYNFKDEPQNGFLNKLRRLCDDHGIVLIFDEVLSGFRVGIQGIQGILKVEPDLSTFAKSICNGYPLAVIGGKRRFADLLNRNITGITNTYNGESLSLTAALKTIEIMKRDQIHRRIYETGGRILTGLRSIIQKNGYPCSVYGMAPLIRLYVETDNEAFNNETMLKLSRDYMAHGMFVREHGGVCFYLNAAHTAADAEEVLDLAHEFLNKYF